MEPLAEPPRREPMVNLPGVVTALAAGLVGLHALRAFLDPETDFALLLELAFVPARWSAAYGEAGVDAVETALAGLDAERARLLTSLARVVLADGDAKVWTGATSALLHASWVHVLMNVAWLVAFGAPVARRLGPARFLALFGAAVLAGAAAVWASEPWSVVPVVGASGGIYGIVAAATWFVFTPVPTWAGRFAPHRRPRQTAGALFANPQAIAFLGVCVLVDLGVALVGGPLGLVDGEIAWQAHVGGLLAGLVLFPWLDPQRDAVGPA